MTFPAKATVSPVTVKTLPERAAAKGPTKTQLDERELMEAVRWLAEEN